MEEDEGCQINMPFTDLDLGNTTDDMESWLTVMTQVGMKLGGEVNSTRTSMKRANEFGKELANIGHESYNDESASMTLAELNTEITFMNSTAYHQKLYSFVNITVRFDESVEIRSPKYRRKLNAPMRKYMSSEEGKIWTSMKRVIEFGKELANIAHESYNDESASKTLAELDTEITFMNWTAYHQKLYGFVNITVRSDKSVKILSPKYLQKLNALVGKYMSSEEGKITINDYLIWQIFPTFPLKFERPKEQSDNSVGCVNEIKNKMRFAGEAMLGVDNQTKLVVEGMNNGIRQDFIEQLQTEPMVGRIKKQIRAHVEAIEYEIGDSCFVDDPDTLDQYYWDLDFVDNDYLINSAQLKLFSLKQQPLKYHVSCSFVRKSFDMMYYSQYNVVAIPERTSREPFIDIGGPKCINYAYFGSNFGHELIHAVDWSRTKEIVNWHLASLEKFKKRSECFVKQYENYTVDGVNINGTQTLNENIADNEGLRLAYHAYVKASNTSNEPCRLPGLNFTDKQLFFITYARQFCYAVSKAEQDWVLKDGVHSLEKYRVIGSLSNLDEFSYAFNCSKTSKMNPDEKCRFW